MAKKKKSDGGAQRVNARRAVANKRKEKKYGLEGFTRQAEKNLKAPGRYIPTARQSGLGIIEASGFGATKAAVKSGVTARAWNKLTRQQVLVHGTPAKIQGKYLKPAAGSPGSPNEAVVFGHNPRYRGSKQSVPPYAREYGATSEGSAVIAKVKKSSLKKIKYQKDNPGTVNNMAAKGNPLDPKNPPWLMSKKPAKIITKVPVSSKNFDKELADALRRAGAPLRGPKKTPLKNMKQKAKNKKSNKKSVV